jgi:hypothetical protein
MTLVLLMDVIPILDVLTTILIAMILILALLIPVIKILVATMNHTLASREILVPLFIVANSKDVSMMK